MEVADQPLYLTFTYRYVGSQSPWNLLFVSDADVELRLLVYRNRSEAGRNKTVINDNIRILMSQLCMAFGRVWKRHRVAPMTP